MTEQQDAPVLTTIRGHLGLITLNRPRAVNALNVEMIGLVNQALDEFEEDANVKVVAIVGSGERGLCAGGDVVALYKAASSDDPGQGIDFFRQEYAFDYRISRYPKPFVAIMNGLVLGGGVGLSVPGSHRVATDSTRTGMPETGIGFSPDVGGLNYLSHAPGQAGKHLALTGLHIDGADAIHAGLADYYVEDAQVEELLKQLEDTENPGTVATVLQEVEAELPESTLAAAASWIDEDYAPETVEEILANVTARVEKDPDNELAASALAALRRNSPTGMKTALEGLTRASNQSLAETLTQDFRTSGNALFAHDMAEGIRAQVIDKDRNPQWQPQTLEDVDRETALGFFEPVPNHEDLRLSDEGATS
ncbi:enoyl-CoA hydratase/isomerase family protein [Kocuria sp. HSID16901]|uniref:enoyl-CoA hydratase/isomerase family protein n=1 Tax=Kocuria sp. HSID16901 TaxID=2419505 RepID=UPI00065FAD5A|nr:enoyl-CoA hydratase/isomerase family protein [Kocuria sp. HSID16901]MCT1367114.1 enoyl-CoA hydratase/isomerase family protein [Rothia sp. p3-SID1597]RUQ21816.1 enoyl-CoA hydratase/isomerase family protein [Kocuria sp. HSID16901]